MHLSHPVAKAAFRSKAVVLLLLTWWGEELVALLSLSSWCLVVVGRLFLAVPRGCLRFVILIFPDHTHLLFLKSKPMGKLVNRIIADSRLLISSLQG